LFSYSFNDIRFEVGANYKNKLLKLGKILFMIACQIV